MLRQRNGTDHMKYTRRGFIETAGDRRRGGRRLLQAARDARTILFLVFLYGSELEAREAHGFVRREAAALDEILRAAHEVKHMFRSISER
jgi:hypothetical protein